MLFNQCLALLTARPRCVGTVRPGCMHVPYLPPDLRAKSERYYVQLIVIMIIHVEAESTRYDVLPTSRVQLKKVYETRLPGLAVVRALWDYLPPSPVTDALGVAVQSRPVWTQPVISAYRRCWDPRIRAGLLTAFAGTPATRSWLSAHGHPCPRTCRGVGMTSPTPIHHRAHWWSDFGTLWKLLPWELLQRALEAGLRRLLASRVELPPATASCHPACPRGSGATAVRGRGHIF